MNMNLLSQSTSSRMETPDLIINILVAISNINIEISSRNLRNLDHRRSHLGPSSKRKEEYPISGKPS